MKRWVERFIPVVTKEWIQMTTDDEDLRLQMVALLPRLQRFARGLTGSRDAADDLLQQTCEKALARFNQFERGTRLDRWMFQIMRTSHLDALRQRQRRGSTNDAQEIIGRVSVDARIEQQTAARQELMRVREAVVALPLEQQEVLMLVVADEMSYQEAAEILGVPQGTIMSRLSRARRKLARAIENGPSPTFAPEGSNF